MHAPGYSYPAGVFAAVIRDILLSRKRDFRQDARACIAALTPPLVVLHPENIPRCGPCVVTVNHYHRPGFGAQWIALAIASVVPVPMHWIMTGEFTYVGKWYQRFGAWGSKFLLERMAAIYGFSSMPPMPPREKDVERRAAAIRVVLEYVMCAGKPEPILGLAPEGYDATNTGVLARPFQGVGRFGLLLSRAGLKFIPAGVHEAGGALHVDFGESYELRLPRGLSADEKDDRASQMIMQRIAMQLPAHLRGEFA